MVVCPNPTSGFIRVVPVSEKFILQAKAESTLAARAVSQPSTSTRTNLSRCVGCQEERLLQERWVTCAVTRAFFTPQVYSQLEAEDSNNELLAKAYGIINSKLDGVASMFFDYTGEG